MQTTKNPKNHRIKIGVYKDTVNCDGLVRYRKVNIRERIMRWLFGDLCRVTIIVPNEKIHDITIQEMTEGD